VLISPTQDFNQMSRNFTHPRTGELCFKSEHTNDYGDIKFHYELLNLVCNQVEIEGFFEADISERDEFINIAKLKAGNYQLTLKNISTSTNIFSVRLCPGMLYFEYTVFHTNVKHLYACRNIF
jgi:hypothetical protein